MKTTFKILFFLLPLFGYSQANLGTGFFGKVGINVGSTSPTERLKVNGATNISGILTLGDISDVRATINAKLSTSTAASTYFPKTSGVLYGLTSIRKKTAYNSSDTLFVIGGLGSDFGAVGQGDRLEFKQVSSTGVPRWDISNYVGESYQTNLTFVAQNIGVKTTSPSFNLDVNGTFRATGTTSLPSTTSIGTVSNTEISYLDNVTSSIQTQLGGKANLSGATFTGNVLLNNVIKVGGSSTFESVFLGQDALNSITSGTQNVAIGKNSLTAITAGMWNTGVGYKTLEVGTTATKNTAIGAYALQSTTTGQYNTAIGYEAGKNNTIGNNNTFIGGFTGNGFANRSNRIWLSDGFGNVKLMADSLGNVGIGTLTPTHTLDVRNISNMQITMGTNAGLRPYWNIGRDNIETGNFNIKDETSIKLSITNNGNIGIGTTSPAATLDINGFIKLKSYTTTEINAIVSPQSGMIVYNSTIAALCFYDGTAWKRVSHSAM